jgi:hypothetical protein
MGDEAGIGIELCPRRPENQGCVLGKLNTSVPLLPLRLALGTV